jgi:predicted transcriptional regulator
MGVDTAMQSSYLTSMNSGAGNAMDTKLLTARISSELADKVGENARLTRRSPDLIVEEALADWLAWEEKKHQMTLEALADVEAGRVVTHEQVVAWAESLDTDNPLPPPLPE